MVHNKGCKTGVGNLFTITGHINYGLCGVTNNSWWYPKILPLSYYEGWMLLITSYFKYMLIMGFRGFKKS